MLSFFSVVCEEFLHYCLVIEAYGRIISVFFLHKLVLTKSVNSWIAVLK